jgi:OOP family OmpA-OmpF porin
LPGPSNVYFDTAKSQLTPDSRQTFNNFVETLKAHPDAHIQLTGHTDNTGSPQANQALSLDRANSVKAMLVNDGISADRISTTGEGQDNPVASNDTADGRGQNRRTELTVTSQ